MAPAETGQASAFQPFSGSGANNNEAADSVAMAGVPNTVVEDMDENDSIQATGAPNTPGATAMEIDVESADPPKPANRTRILGNNRDYAAEVDDEIGFVRNKPLYSASESSSEDSDDEEDWMSFSYVVENADEHLVKKDKIQSEQFSTYNGWPWRIGVHWNGVKNEIGRCVSVFLEIGDYDTKTGRGDPSLNLPRSRVARFELDILTNRPDKMRFSEFARKAERGEIEGINPNDRDLKTKCGRKAKGTFSWDSYDCGFADAITREALSRFCVTDQKTATFIVRVISEASSYGSVFDSKRNTDMVGLLNQGATCYLNSLLQTLYHTRALRRAVYALDTLNEKAENGVAYELQHLFADLQTKSTAVSTQALTKAFGWTDSQVFTQHDVQELLRELLDKLEARMMGTDQATAIKDLFCGQFATYIKCINVPCERIREEEFFDLQLDVRGSRSVLESFQKYVQEERLENENQYDAEGFGKQDAIKGVKFLKFPPVLHLHLKRFAYNYEDGHSYKIHDRFEFSETLDLGGFIPPETLIKEGGDYVYQLHSVLVHSGNDQRGHYYAFVYADSPVKHKPHWYKFDDEAVTRVKRRVAIDHTFGTGPVHLDSLNGNSGGNYQQEESRGMYATAAGINGLNAAKRFRTSSEYGIDSNASAYMLVYVRRNRWQEIMKPTEVPAGLQERFERDIKQKQLEKEMAERNRHMGRMKVATWDDVKIFNELKVTKQRENDDWVSWDRCKEIEYGDQRYATEGDLYKAVRKAFLHLKDVEFRLWLTCERENETCRLDRDLNPTSEKLVIPRQFNSRVYLEVPEDGHRLPKLSDDDLSLLFREYDPEIPGVVPGSGKMVFCTGLTVNGRSSLAQLWTCLAKEVLGRNDVDKVKEEYSLFELTSNSYTETHNVKALACSEETIINGDEASSYEFEPRGDIVLYVRKDKQGKPLTTFIKEQCHYVDIVFQPLYPGITVPAPPSQNGLLVSVFDSTLIKDELIPELCSRLAPEVDPSTIELSLGPDPSRTRLTPREYTLKILHGIFRCNSNMKSSKFRDPTAKTTIYYDVLCKPREEMGDIRSVRALVHLPVENSGTSSISIRRTASGVACPPLRWDHPIVERFFAEPSTTGAELYKELRGRPTIAKYLDRYEFVLYVVSREGHIDTVILNDDELLGIGLDRYSAHGVTFIDTDGYATLPNSCAYRTDSSRLIGELVERPVDEGKHSFKIQVAHCTMRDEGTDPQSMGMPILMNIVEGDTLGSFWKRLLSRINVASELSAAWRPMLCIKVGEMSRIVLLDAASSGSKDDTGDGASITVTSTMSFNSQFSNMTRARIPRVPQEEYDAQPLWSRPALQNALTNAMLSSDASGEGDEGGDGVKDVAILQSVIFYIRHPNGTTTVSTAAPNRTSTPVLTIRSQSS